MSLTLKNIYFSYEPPPAKPLIEDFSLSIAEGESVALMAPSGRGKSTLLAIAGLLLKQGSGSVLIDGQEVLPDTPTHELLGSEMMWIFQSTNLLPRRSVLDNVVLPLVIKGVNRAEAEVLAVEALKAVNLHLDANRQARTLSGGEAQRVGVARALAPKPKVILADEPTANLDKSNAELVAQALFRSDHKSAIFVATHDHNVAGFADRVVEL